MKFNNILKVILLSKFCLCSAFISNLHIKKSNLKLNAIDNPASIISKFGVGNEWTYNQFLDKINNNEIDGVSILSDEKGLAVIDKLHTDDILSNNIHYIKILPNMINDIIIQLNSHHVTYDILKIPESNGFDFSLPLKFVGTYVVGVLVINVLLSLFRGNKSPFDRNSINNENFDPFNFNKHTNLVDTELLNSSFDDVAGCDEAKNELMEVVDFLKNPKKYEEAGAKIPKGILLEGEPGTGKTLLARAVAGEAGVSFLSASGSEFIEMFVGVGASRVRKLFDNARKNSPCVIFIDEIDAVGRQRGAGINSGNDEREQTLNQILTNMDGFTASTGIIVLAATNRADILDDALLRPGRFDRKINVPLPDLEGRKEIFRVHTRDKKLDNNTDINEIAILTTGFSGADICNLANEAAILSVRNNRTRIDRQTILDAYEKITIGLPSLKNTEDESVVKLVSYHEIGHAFMVKYFEEFFDLRKVTINANKGGAGGYTLFTPKQRFMSYPTKKYMLANLVIALGGRAAEVHLYSDNKNRETDVVFKEIKNLDITTGASNDLKQADNIARKYIQLFGLSDDSSLVNNNVESSSQPFLGRELALGGDRISEYSKEKTDKMVCKLITDCYRIALNLIDANPKNFNKLAEKLIKERTLDASDFENLKFKY
jgi:cell division protease FtsH